MDKSAKRSALLVVELIFCWFPAEELIQGFLHGIYFGGNQTLQMYCNFEGFGLNSA